MVIRAKFITISDFPAVLGLILENYLIVETYRVSKKNGELGSTDSFVIGFSRLRQFFKST